MKKTLQTIALLGSLALVGCDSKPRYSVDPKYALYKVNPVWREKDVKDRGYTIDLPMTDENGIKYTEKDTIIDIDKDGKADVIVYGNSARFVAREHVINLIGRGPKASLEKYGFRIDSTTITMNDNIREKATKLMHAQAEFTREYLKSKRLFEEAKN